MKAAIVIFAREVVTINKYIILWSVRWRMGVHRVEFSNSISATFRMWTVLFPGE